MDLGAYLKIGSLEELAKKNGIEVQRLRGYRLMKAEEHLTEKDINELIEDADGDVSRDAIMAQYNVFNKYCGRKDVLYIHARLGGENWKYYGGPELEKQPWFIEKVDDAFDSTYCDIYARISDGVEA